MNIGIHCEVSACNEYIKYHLMPLLIPISCTNQLVLDNSISTALSDDQYSQVVIFFRRATSYRGRCASNCLLLYNTSMSGS